MPSDDVAACIAKVSSLKRRENAEALLSLMQRVTAEAPRMWSSSIIGFGPVPLQVRKRP